MYRREYFEATCASLSTAAAVSKESEQPFHNPTNPREYQTSLGAMFATSGPGSSASESPTFPSTGSDSVVDASDCIAKGCSDMSSCSRITNAQQSIPRGKKREPNPEMCAWLKKALKKQHVDALISAGVLE